MDVRCEKCLTVYEFDEGKVGPAGVAVKCAECGNLFKVKRRADTAELPVGAAIARAAALRDTAPPAAPPAASIPAAPRPAAPPVGTPPAGQRAAPAAMVPPPVVRGPASPIANRPPSGSATPAAPSAPDEASKGWQVRVAATGAVLRFRELTTLQQWIVERKVTRDDEISRSGDSWKRLGGIVELASFFHVVEQAAAVTRAPEPAAAAHAAHAAYGSRAETEDPALTTTAPMEQLPVFVQDRPSGPISMGSMGAPGSSAGFTAGLGGGGNGDPAFAGGGSARDLAGPESTSEDELDDESPRRGRGGLYAGLLSLLLLAAAGGYFGVYRRDVVKRLFTAENRAGKEALREGRERFLLDSDDQFRQAVVAFERAHGADESDPLPLAALSEVNTTWAWYLREDALAIESTGHGGEAAARTLRSEAQAHLEAAKRYAAEALTLQPGLAAVNRAMADCLRVEGAPAAEVDRYLKHALELAPNDPETTYVSGALLFREGKAAEAKPLFEEADQLNVQATQHRLLRAEYLLARLAIAAGDKPGARKAAELIVQVNGQHDRAKALLAQIAEAAPNVNANANPSVNANANPSVNANANAKPTPAPAPAPTVAAPKAADDKKAEPAVEGDYKKLVAQADRLSENGHAARARKLYEKALEQNPQGLEAITGIAYCDLDAEHFIAAVEHFQQALAISPDYGEALIGLAEAYKIRSDRAHAIEYYKRYLSALPNGPKALMAQKNLRDLEPPAGAQFATKPAPPPPQPKPSEPAEPEAAKPVRPAANEGELPRPPPVPDEPPP